MKFVWLMLAAFAEPQALRIPVGLDAYIPIPETNPITKEGVQLGRKLFLISACRGTIRCHAPLAMTRSTRSPMQGSSQLASMGAAINVYPVS